MKPIRLGSALAFAVLAVSLAATSAASATLPSFNTTKVKLTGTQSGPNRLSASLNIVICTANKSSGEATAAMLLGGLTIDYTGCTSSGGTKSGCPINSIGAPVGLILTKTLHGTLGIALPSGAAAILLLPISGKEFASLEGNECTPETAVSGDVAGLITPTGKVQTTGKIVLNVVSEAQEVKDIDTLAGLVVPKLTSFSTTALLEDKENLTWAKALEVT
jgi:hypothetical protein